MADETSSVVGWDKIKQIYKNKDLSMEFVLTKTAGTQNTHCTFSLHLILLAFSYILLCVWVRRRWNSKVEISQ